MLNKTFFTDIEHEGKNFRNKFRNFLNDLPLEKVEVKEEKYTFQFKLDWHDKVNYFSGFQT